MDPTILELLGLPEDATLEDVCAAIGELLRMVAEGAADAGADATADAVDAAADATDEAADAAADDQDAIDEATGATAASVVIALSKEVRRLHTRLDATDRATLMSGRSFTPGLRKWLMSQSLDVVRSYVATIPIKAEPRAPKGPVKGTKAAELSPEDLQLCAITGMDPAIMLAQRTLENAGTRRPALKHNVIPTNNGRTPR